MGGLCASGSELLLMASPPMARALPSSTMASASATTADSRTIIRSEFQNLQVLTVRLNIRKTRLC
jgi:hypothetical protein